MKLRPPVRGWQRKRRGLVGGDLLLPLTVIATAFAGLVLLGYLQWRGVGHRGIWFGAQLVLLVVGGFMIYLTQARIKQNLLEPLAHLRHWAHRMQGGNLSARIPVPEHGDFAKLAKDINDLGESLRSLSREMDGKVREQTERLEQKTKTLAVLYDVAANSNTSRDIEALLIKYLKTLITIVHAKAGSVRLLTQDNRLRLVGKKGIPPPLSANENLVPIEHCICAQNFSQSVITCAVERRRCGNLLPDTLGADDCKRIIVLPLQYQNRTLGIYHFFLDDIEIDNAQETRNLLTNIAQHLSLAIEKVRMDDESKRLTIMQERTMLAHELHDSLAQTLASLRFQVRLLDKSVQKKNFPAVTEEIVQLKNGLDEANAELRELLAHFRVHMDERGLIPATEALVERFKNESGIAVFFQNECKDLTLPPIQEVQVLHIIQESLANIRKHSNAQHVRVLIRQTDAGRYHVLVEDDGVGISDAKIHGQPGEHVGLTIMKERARRINGSLTIESDEGEGTRVELDFCVGENQGKDDELYLPLEGESAIPSLVKPEDATH